MNSPNTPIRVTQDARTRGQRGFALIDVLIAGCVLVIGSLGLAASVCTSHRLAQSVEERGLAVATAQRLVERLRADPDWNGLYARLLPLSRESAGDTTLTWLKVDPSLPTYPLSTYYADLTAPSTLGTVTALVQVPSSTVAGVAALREDLVAPRYRLPHDLNGDLVVDSNARSADYRSIPVVVRLRWQRAPRQPDEIVICTWLRGDR